MPQVVEDPTQKRSDSLEKKYAGKAVVGRRGRIVIPSAARLFVNAEEGRIYGVYVLPDDCILLIPKDEGPETKPTKD